MSVVEMTKAGVGDDAAPSGAPPAAGRKFTIPVWVNNEESGKAIVTFDILDAGGSSVDNSYATVSLWINLATVWTQIGSSKVINRGTRAIFVFGDLPGDCEATLRFESITGGGAASVKMYVQVEAGELHWPLDTQGIPKVSTTAAALPAGAATEAKQDTGNTSLASIDGKFTTLNAKDFATETTLAALSAKLPAAAAPADAESTATATTALRARETVYNGTTWDRIRGSLAGVTAAVVATWTGFLHVLGFGRYVAARPTLADGEGSHLHMNTRGDITVQEMFPPDYEDNDNDVAWVSARATNTATGAWTNYHSGTTKVGTVGLSVKAIGGRVRRIGGCHDTGGAAVVYLCLVDKASAPTANDPVICALPIAAGASALANFEFGPEGIYLPTGIAIAFSSTHEKITLIGASDCSAWVTYY